MNIPSLSNRAAGVLLHPTSLPGLFGAGDLGPEAYQFADALHKSGLRWWQMLPVNPPGPGPGYSPYSAQSAFAGSAWLISPEMLFKHGLLSKSELAAAQSPGKGRINFSRNNGLRLKVLRTAFHGFRGASPPAHADFDRFCRLNADWLDNDALFMAIREHQRGKSWQRWPTDLALRKPGAIAAAQKSLHDRIQFQKFVQWQFDRQWTSLKNYCHLLGIGLIGDIPIFVSHDSAPVWASRHLFLLDTKGKPKVVTGYPPDPFTKLGQLWGHPHYNWRAHVAEGFEWWIARFERLFSQFDAARIDHFLGFHRLWAIPANAKNAIGGKWIPVPGDQLLGAIQERLGEPPIIAEDLGRQTPQALALRDKYGFPGMRVLQFGFGDEPYHLPHTFTKHCVAYTGTHDNHTIVGWFHSLKKNGNGELARTRTYIGDLRKAPQWGFIRSLFTSVANTVIIPLQDYLGLGSDHRMNTPGIAEGNWGWRMNGPIPKKVVDQIRALAEATGRADELEKQGHFHDYRNSKVGTSTNHLHKNGQLKRKRVAGRSLVAAR
jgi:4-alpha-glucanotransferase